MTVLSYTSVSVRNVTFASVVFVFFYDNGAPVCVVSYKIVLHQCFFVLCFLCFWQPYFASQRCGETRGKNYRAPKTSGKRFMSGPVTAAGRA